MFFTVTILIVAAALQTACSSCGATQKGGVVAATPEQSERLLRAANAVRAANPALLCQTMKPSGVQVPQQPAGQHRVTLTWVASVAPPENPVQGYCIYRSTVMDDTMPGLLNTTPVSATKCVDLRVTNNVTYYYTVAAIDSVGQESKLSKGTTAKIPDTPGSGPPAGPPVLSCWGDGPAQ